MASNYIAFLKTENYKENCDCNECLSSFRRYFATENTIQKYFDKNKNESIGLILFFLY